jgi:hypothetical protein
LAGHFYLDEIDLNSWTTENSNYIDNVIGIQTTVNSDLFAIVNNFEYLKFGYNFIEANSSMSSITDLSNHVSEFKIDQFIDQAGVIYQENEVDYKLYNINIDIPFKLIVTAKKELFGNYINDKIINIEYVIDDIIQCESSYIPDVNLEDLSNISHDTTVINFINDSTSITLSNIDSTAFSFEENVELSDQIILNKDETLNIDISLSNFNLSNDINHLDIFSSYKYNDFIDIHIKDDYYNHNIYHLDVVGKTFNTYKVNLSNEYKFYTFGNLPKKCKTWMST